MKKHVLLIGLLLICCDALADYPLEIIELKGRPVDEVIPLVRPFVGPDGVVTGMNNQLIIRTSPDRLQEIHKILDRFDRPPRQLVILVHHGRMMGQERRQAGAGINSKIGKHARVEAGIPTPEESIRIRAGSKQSTTMIDVSHSVMATEGKPAFITTGQSVPITEQSTYISRGRIRQETTTRYRDAIGGFYVVPQLNGDQVTLRISTRMDKADQASGTFDIQHIDTAITGRLGEWISIGAVNQESNQRAGATLQRHSTTGRDDRQIYLLVKALLDLNRDHSYQQQ